MQARLGDWLSFGYRPLGNSSLSEGTISSGGDGNEREALSERQNRVELDGGIGKRRRLGVVVLIHCGDR